eukprot:6804995-Prymnesium_polylepis.1
MACRGVPDGTLGRNEADDVGRLPSPLPVLHGRRAQPTGPHLVAEPQHRRARRRLRRRRRLGRQRWTLAHAARAAAPSLCCATPP